MENLLDFLSKELAIFIMSAIPVIELRGAIPVGISLGINSIEVVILCLMGSMLPVPFLLLLLQPLFDILRRNKKMRGLVDKIIKRTIKRTNKVHKYKALGLLLFVAIPIPTTGVWTGAMAASLLRIPFWPAIINIFIGNTIAALIVTAVTLHIV